MPQMEQLGQPESPDARALRDGMLSLQRMVSDMQGSLQQLRDDNASLRRHNLDLEAQNRAMMESLSEQDYVQTWSQFDIVEEHYKQIARHQAQDRADGRLPGEGDSAAGTPPASPPTQEHKEAEAELDIAIGAANRDEVQSLSARIVAAVVARGWRREEITGIKPDGFRDSSGATIEAENPQGLVDCENWPLTLQFVVRVKRAESPPWVIEEPKALRANAASRDDVSRRKSTGSMLEQRRPMTYRLDDDAIPITSALPQERFDG